MKNLKEYAAALEKAIKEINETLKDIPEEITRKGYVYKLDRKTTVRKIVNKICKKNGVKSRNVIKIGGF